MNRMIVHTGKSENDNVDATTGCYHMSAHTDVLHALSGKFAIFFPSFCPLPPPDLCPCVFAL